MSTSDRSSGASPPSIHSASALETRRNEEVAQARRFAQQIAVVRREAFRAVEEGADAGLRQRRDPPGRHFQFRRNLVPIVRERAELEVRRHAVDRPWLCLWLEEADEQLAGVLLEVRTFVGHAQHRRMPWQTRHRLGHDIEMFAGLNRNGNARRTADLSRPQARAIDHDIGGDRSLIRAHAGRAPALGRDACHGDVLEDPRAA